MRNCIKTRTAIIKILPIPLMAVVLLAPLAFAQRHSVVVLPSLAAAEAKFTTQQLELLTDEVRSIAAKLPPENFFLMKQDRVIEELGDEAFFTACKEGTCVGTLVKRLQANFGARCDVSVVAGQLYLKFELYGTLMGQSESQTVDQFNDPVKNFAEMQFVIRKKVPGMFNKITKSPQEVCEAAGSAWMNGVCWTAAQLAQRACESEGKTWIGGACKSVAQITCEATAGRRWAGDECKTLEQIACESEGKSWINGICVSQTAVSAAPAMSGNYVAQVMTEPAGASLKLNGMTYQGCPKTPCTISLYENRFTLSAVLSEHETKDTAITITMPNQLVSLKLKPITYYVVFSTEPPGASLALESGKDSHNCRQAPCGMSIKAGAVKVSASLDFHERKDTTVLIAGNNQQIKHQQVKLKLNPNYGMLEIKGASAGWNLTVGDKRTDKRVPLNNIKLSPGAYKAKLTHDDYEDIDFSVEIKKGGREFFGISDKMVYKFGTLEIKGAGAWWDLSIGGKRVPLDNIRLLPGAYKAKLAHEDYEDIDFRVEIAKGEHSVFDVLDSMKVHKFGILDIAPAYIDNIGQHEDWYLMAGGDESFPLGEVKLLPGEHEVVLSHDCYEDIKLNAKIERNRKTSFDMSNYLVLKKGTLVLRAKRKVRNLARSVYVNGVHVGETPFEGPVPLCAGIKIENAGNWEEIDIEHLEQNKTIEYTHRESTIGSHLIGAALDVAGAVFFVLSYNSLNERDKAYDAYADSEKTGHNAYSGDWKKVEKYNSSKNAFLIIGSAALAMGIGMHIWF